MRETIKMHCRPNQQKVSAFRLHLTVPTGSVVDAELVVRRKWRSRDSRGPRDRENSTSLFVFICSLLSWRGVSTGCWTHRIHPLGNQSSDSSITLREGAGKEGARDCLLDAGPTCARLKESLQSRC